VELTDGCLEAALTTERMKLPFRARDRSSLVGSSLQLQLFFVAVKKFLGDLT
jgi:hypothetical protein